MVIVAGKASPMCMWNIIHVKMLPIILHAQDFNWDQTRLEADGHASFHLVGLVYQAGKSVLHELLHLKLMALEIEVNQIQRSLKNR